MANNMYWKKAPKGQLTESMSQNPSTQFYWSPKTRKAFGSELQQVYSNRTNDKFIFTEKLKNAPDGKPDYKVGYYNARTGNFEDSMLYDSSAERNRVVKEMKSSEDPGQTIRKKKYSAGGPLSGGL